MHKPGIDSRSFVLKRKPLPTKPLPLSTIHQLLWNHIPPFTGHRLYYIHWGSNALYPPLDETTHYLSNVGIVSLHLQVDTVIQNHLHGIESPAGETMPKCLVIDGTTLAHIFHGSHAKSFLKLADKCLSVLCCRTTPSQKAQVSVVNCIVCVSQRKWLRILLNNRGCEFKRISR